MDAALPIGLALLGLASIVALADGAMRRRRLAHLLERAWLDVPRDPASGLFDRRVCLQRIAAEVKRARRGGGTVWVGVITVVDGNADRFGRLLLDSMRTPEVGFRLAPQVVVIARPDLDAARREELLGRIAAAAPRERLALGKSTWRGPADGDASRLLHAASAATRENRSA